MLVRFCLRRALPILCLITVSVTLGDFFLLLREPGTGNLNSEEFSERPKPGGLCPKYRIRDQLDRCKGFQEGRGITTRHLRTGRLGSRIYTGYTHKGRTMLVDSVMLWQRWAAPCAQIGQNRVGCDRLGKSSWRKPGSRIEWGVAGLGKSSWREPGSNYWYLDRNSSGAEG